MQFCTQCGNKVGKTDKFCTHCGAPLIHMESENMNTESSSPSAPNPSLQKPQKQDELINRENINQKLNQYSAKAKQFVKTTSASQSKSPLFYICVALSVLGGLLPFFPWMRVPIINSLGNFFLGNNSISSYSLFTSILADSTGNTASAIMLLVLSIAAIIAIIFYILFIIKGLKSNRKYYKYGTIASIIMIVITVIFLLIFGLVSSISMGLIEITFSPWLELIGAIANIILIQSLKTKERAAI